MSVQPVGNSRPDRGTRPRRPKDIVDDRPVKPVEEKLEVTGDIEGLAVGSTVRVEGVGNETTYVTYYEDANTVDESGRFVMGKVPRTVAVATEVLGEETKPTDTPLGNE